MDIKRRAALLSFAASFIILGLKYWAFHLTGSTALLSDALESIVNVVAAGVALTVMRAVAAPADEEHPYGHGKLEYFSSAFEGGLITFAGIMIAREAVLGFLGQRTPQNLDFGLIVSAGAGVANLALGLYLRQVGRRYRSEALTASGQHVLSDVWSTLGAFVGLMLVMLTGREWFDHLAALLIAVQLSYSGYGIVRRSIGGLIDEVEMKTLEELSAAFEKSRSPGVIDIHLVKMIRGGNFHHIDGHLVVPEFWQVLHSHELMEKFEHDVVRAYPFDGEINFHLDPCEQSYCTICELENCPVRKQPFAGHREFTAQTVIRGPMKDLV